MCGRTLVFAYLVSESHGRRVQNPAGRSQSTPWLSFTRLSKLFMALSLPAAFDHVCLPSAIPALASIHGWAEASVLRPLMCANEGSSSSEQASGASSSIEILKGPTANDVKNVAEFFSRNYFDPDLNLYQQMRVYGLFCTSYAAKSETLKGKLPYALIVARDNEEIVGSVCLECRVLNERRRLLREIDQTDNLRCMIYEQGENEIALVINNLAVCKDRRGTGLARRLLSEAEDRVKAWGYSQLYLLVSLKNTPARRLYESSGYSALFKYKEKTFVYPGQFTLKEQPEPALCMRKCLEGPASRK